MPRPKKQRTDDKLLARISNLADLVEYQEGSVVSRTIMDKKSGTVTLFAFDEGRGLSEHTAPFDAMGLDCTPMIGQIGLGESGGVSRYSPD